MYPSKNGFSILEAVMGSMIVGADTKSGKAVIGPMPALFVVQSQYGRVAGVNS